MFKAFPPLHLVPAPISHHKPQPYLQEDTNGSRSSDRNKCNWMVCFELNGVTLRLSLLSHVLPLFLSYGVIPQFSEMKIFLQWNGHLRVWIWYCLLQHSASFPLHMNVLLCARHIDQDPFDYRDRNSVKTNLSKIITKNNFGKYNGSHTHNLECWNQYVTDG